MKIIVAVLAVLLSAPAWAQESVQPIPDKISWATAAVNPAIAVIRAFQSDHTQCALWKLATTGGVASAGLIAQHFIKSPRPCAGSGSAGCEGNGNPSMHSAFGVVGVSQGIPHGWGVAFSVSMSVGTAGLRVDANRHTPKQVAMGLLWGGLAELAGQKLVRCES